MLRDRRLTKQLPQAYYRLAGASPRIESFLARMNMGRRDAQLADRVGASFRGPRVALLAQRMERVADELLAPLVERGTFDVAEDFALPFPMIVMCDLLGIPEADRDAVWPRGAALLAAFSDAAFLGDRDLGEAERALAWLQEYLGELLCERRRRPADDLLSDLLAPDASGAALADAEIVDSAVRVFYAGFETSKGMLTNGVAALLDHPDELRRLRGDQRLLAPAVDEFLRYDAPIQVSLRVALEPIEVGGRTVRTGRVVVILIGSANRDERRFADPDRFDVGRRPHGHLAFGGGLHYCLGAALAKQEGVVALRRLLARTTAIEPAGERARPRLVNLRCLDRLPVAVRAR
jgi:cytochrome P450